MSLQDFKPMQERCSNCSFCKWIPFDKVKSIRFAQNCPSVVYNNFNTYSARGRFQLGAAINNGEIDYSGKAGQVAHDCLSCGACDVSCKICRYNLEPLEHNIALKNDAVEKGILAPGQKEMIEALKAEKTLVAGAKKADRTAWANGLGLKDVTKEAAEVLFFPGCHYSYDTALRDSVRGMVEMLKNAGVDLGYLGNADVCCAGRAYQMGFFKEFEAAANNNISAFKQFGVKVIVTPCADCYQAFKRLYAKLGLDVQVLHIVEFVDQLVEDGKIKFTKKLDLDVTYHDPCHLGRLAEPYVEWNGKEKKILNQVHTWEPRRPRYNGAYGVYDIPRHLISSIPGVRLHEMERIREYSWCCGAGGGCNVTDEEFSVWTATERLEEAVSTGASALVTACPWCKTNFNKVTDGPKMEIVDIIDLVRSAL